MERDREVDRLPSRVVGRRRDGAASPKAAQPLHRPPAIDVTVRSRAFREPDVPPRAVHVVDGLGQARELADPGRVRLLAAFTGAPRTTKQVADALGVPATRLYRHVEALRKAGLLVARGERRKRGTVEKYLQAVARRFEVASDLFAPPSPRGSDGVGRLFRSAEAAAREALAGAPGEGEAAPLVAGVEVRVTPAEFQRLRRRLMRWLAECERSSSSPDATLSGKGLVAFVPLSRPSR